jgi:hypothetical protein
MNPRNTFKAILGWCPGFQSASRFLPDREVSNRRIALSAIVLLVAVMSTYLATEKLLIASGFPSNANLSFQYNNPVIREKDGHLYLAVEQDSSTSGGSVGYPPSASQESIIFSELLENGTLRNTISIAKVNGLGGGMVDFIYSKTGKWMLVYYLSGINSENTPLNYVTSSDGKTWSPSTTVYTGIVDGAPTLLERGDGSLFLEFAVVNGTSNPHIEWLYSINNGGTWSASKRTPFTPSMDSEFLHESAFIDRNGDAGVVWDMGDPEGIHDLGLRYSMLIDGKWSDPQPITSDSITLMGQNPRIIYSANRGGYYLTLTNLQQGGNNPATQLFYSSNWVSWSLQSYVQSALDGSVTEFSNGELGMVYDIRSVDGSQINLNYIRSVDGSTWGPPHLIEPLKNAEFLSLASQSQRDSASFVVSVVILIAVLFALIRLPSLHIFSKTLPELSG